MKSRDEIWDDKNATRRAFLNTVGRGIALLSAAVLLPKKGMATGNYPPGCEHWDLPEHEATVPTRIGAPGTPEYINHDNVVTIPHSDGSYCDGVA